MAMVIAKYVFSLLFKECLKTKPHKTMGRRLDDTKKNWGMERAVTNIRKRRGWFFGVFFHPFTLFQLCCIISHLHYIKDTSSQPSQGHLSSDQPSRGRSPFYRKGWASVARVKKRLSLCCQTLSLPRNAGAYASVTLNLFCLPSTPAREGW